MCTPYPTLDYLIRFSTQHESFRLAEIEALTQRLNADLPAILAKHGKAASRGRVVDARVVLYEPTSPFALVHFTLHPSPPDIHVSSTLCQIASSFISHSILSRAIYELWGMGTSYPALHDDIKFRSKHFWSQYKRDVSFKFSVDSWMHKRSAAEHKTIINGFSYLGFEGKVNMRKPDQEWCVMEEWMPADPSENGQIVSDNPGDMHVDNGVSTFHAEAYQGPRTLSRVFLGRKIASSRRHLIEKHDLKKRPYISTTSMDAELALVTATLALATPGKLFMDPFCGTGGFMVSAAELGAVVLGSDIDGRSFRGGGLGLEEGVMRNMKLYGIDSLFGDCVTSDLIHTPFRLGRRRWLDGIIADIPYGVREGLKVLGRRQTTAEESDSKQPFLIDGIPAHKLPGYIAPKKPYSFNKMLEDILDFAARALVDGGRLAFWMPTANENGYGEEEATRIPKHPLLELKHECIQRFNKWSRVLLVYERLSGDVEETAAVEDVQKLAVNGTRANELNPFRRRYFQAFAEKPDG